MPSGCPEELYFLLLQCWSRDEDRRPSFLQLQSMLPKLASNFSKFGPNANDSQPRVIDVWSNPLQLHFFNCCPWFFFCFCPQKLEKFCEWGYSFSVLNSFSLFYSINFFLCDEIQFLVLPGIDHFSEKTRLFSISNSRASECKKLDCRNQIKMLFSFAKWSIPSTATLTNFSGNSIIWKNWRKPNFFIFEIVEVLLYLLAWSQNQWD